VNEFPVEHFAFANLRTHQFTPIERVLGDPSSRQAGGAADERPEDGAVFLSHYQHRFRDLDASNQGNPDAQFRFDCGRLQKERTIRQDLAD